MAKERQLIPDSDKATSLDCLGYEISTILAYAVFMESMKVDAEGTEWWLAATINNSPLESFILKARLLHDFSCDSPNGKNKDDILASDILPDWKWSGCGIRHDDRAKQ